MKRLVRASILPACLLAVLVLAGTGASLDADFVWDDRPLIVDNPWVKDPAGFVHILTSSFWETGDRHDRFRSFFRPVVSLSYGIDHSIWGLSPRGFHRTNLLIHFLCCWLVFRIALREGAVPPVAALAGAALFAAHPVHVESVAWISGRTDLLCGAFVLGAFLAHRMARPAGGSWKWRAASVGLFLLALFSKEMAATFPVLVFADVWVDRARDGNRLRRALVAALPYVAALAVYLVVRVAVLGSGAPALFTLTPSAFAGTAMFVAARYLTLLILPVGLDAHYPYQAVASPFTALALVGGAILIVVLAASVRAYRNHPRSAFWIGWILVGLLPVMAFGRFGDVLMADRFLYIPSVGLALLAARGLGILARPGRPAAWGRAAYVATAIAVLALTAASWRQTAVWRDDLALFSDMVETSPSSALVRNNLGLAHYYRGDYRVAQEEFRTALSLAPGYALSHNNLAAALEREGRLSEALAEYREALSIAPALIEARTNVGHLLVQLGRPTEGLSILRAQAVRQPRSPAVLYALAEALDATGNDDEALRVAARIQRLDPRHAESIYLTGKILHERGRTREAAVAMARFLEIWPSDGSHAVAARRVIDGGAVSGDRTGTAR